MVLFASKTESSMPERFVCPWCEKALYKYSSVPFLSFPGPVGKGKGKGFPILDTECWARS